MTATANGLYAFDLQFQYRKRYEVTCDVGFNFSRHLILSFNTASGMRSHVTGRSILSQLRAMRFNTASGMRSHVTRRPRSVERMTGCFNTASGMRSHVTQELQSDTGEIITGFNTASGMRSHVTLCPGGRRNRRLKSWFWKTSSKSNM